jgi:serine protease AprX
LSPDTVKARLLKSATRDFPAFSIAVDSVTGESFESQYDIFTIGAGYLDVWAALNSTDTVPSGMTAASPLASYDSSTGIVSVVNADTAVWGLPDSQGFDAVWATKRTAVWGTACRRTAVWGTGTDAVSGSASRRTAVWGTGTSGATSLGE